MCWCVTDKYLINYEAVLAGMKDMMIETIFTFKVCNNL